MEKHHATRVIPILLLAGLMIGVADRAQAAAILFANIHVVLDATGTTAEVIADLQAFSDDGNDVFLDGINVGLSENGEPIEDLFAGPPALDDLPFYVGLPLSVSNGQVLNNSLLFILSGLVPDTGYSGFFDVQFTGDGISGASRGDFAFTTLATTVPEPGTLLLLASGCGLLFRRGRKRSQSA